MLCTNHWEKSRPGKEGNYAPGRGAVGAALSPRWYHSVLAYLKVIPLGLDGPRTQLRFPSDFQTISWSQCLLNRKQIGTTYWYQPANPVFVGANPVFVGANPVRLVRRRSFPLMIRRRGARLSASSGAPIPRCFGLTRSPPRRTRSSPNPIEFPSRLPSGVLNWVSANRKHRGTTKWVPANPVRLVRLPS